MKNIVAERVLTGDTPWPASSGRVCGATIIHTNNIEWTCTRKPHSRGAVHAAHMSDDVLIRVAWTED